MLRLKEALRIKLDDRLGYITQLLKRVKESWSYQPSVWKYYYHCCAVCHLVTCMFGLIIPAPYHSS